MDNILPLIINEYGLNKNSAGKYIGRYKGWVLICGDLAIKIEKDYGNIKNELNKIGYNIQRWSSLSFESVDHYDFAVKVMK